MVPTAAQVCVCMHVACTRPLATTTSSIVLYRRIRQFASIRPCSLVAALGELFGSSIVRDAKPRADTKTSFSVIPTHWRCHLFTVSVILQPACNLRKARQCALAPCALHLPNPFVQITHLLIFEAPFACLAAHCFAHLCPSSASLRHCACTPHRHELQRNLMYATSVSCSTVELFQHDDRSACCTQKRR